MNLLLQVLGYVCVAVFVVAVFLRYRRISRYPLNVRWEIYPVPHEGERSKHGGSRMEDTDWWEKSRKPDHIMELKYMIPEMVFVKGLFEHNRRLWYRSFPFHFGLYVSAAFLGLLALFTILDVSGLTEGLLFDSLLTALGLAGFTLTLVGALGLLIMRISDPELSAYSNFSHYFNLLFIIAAFGLAFAAAVVEGFTVAPFASYLAALFTFSPAVITGGGLSLAAVVATALLIAYIPLTHMSHFFTKWFTWHKIRWDDEPNVRGGRIEKMIEKALAAPVTWSAAHVKADGKKSWADVAGEEVEDR